MASEHKSGHGHQHGVIDRHADWRLLSVALGIIGTFMVGEVVAGIVAGSLALLADAGHLLTDSGALALSIWSIRMALRPATGHLTFGYKRAEILSAAINGVVLLVGAGAVIVGASLRLVTPAPVAGSTISIVASIGVFVNLAALAVISRASRTSLNVSSVWGHLITDLWAFSGTLVAGVVIVTTGFRQADPLASLLVAALMVRTAYSLLGASGRILLEAAPSGIDLEEIHNHLREVDHVLDVHDLHVWVVTSDLPALSAHVVIEDSCFTDGHAPRVLDQLQDCLAGHFDLAHSTFQLETREHASHEDTSH